MLGFKATDSALFFSRNDPRDPRLGDSVKPLTGDPIDGGSFVIGGFPDDEGISLNGGRPGARLAPDTIRRYLYKMTPRLQSTRGMNLFDAGNLDLYGTLAQRHERARAAVQETLKKGAYWIGLGGGHDYGYADGAGFLEFFRQSDARPLIINFDAHLDVRPTDRGLTSGTPFFRLLNDFEGFDLFQIGIQGHCNSQTHYNWCIEQGCKVLFMEELVASDQSLKKVGETFLKGHLKKNSPCYISVDIDGFSSSFAPGCSQSWATGFDPKGFFPFFDWLLQNLDVRVLGIYEVSPALDQDDRTSKLAAQIVHRYLFQPG